MKKLFVLGISILALLIVSVGCANPLVGSDGGAVVVSDLVAAAGVAKVDLTWTDPEVSFSGLKVEYSAEGVETVTVDVAKGDGALSVTDLTAGTEYTFVVKTVAENGVVAAEGASITATPKGSFTAPFTPEVIGVGTPGGWDGNGAMTKVSEYEWTYTFLTDGTDLEFKIRELGSWDNAYTNLEDAEIAVGTAFELRTGDELPNMSLAVEGEGRITMTFKFENDEGVPELLVEYEESLVAPFSPKLSFVGGTNDGESYYMGMVTQNEWEITMDVTAGDTLEFVIGNNDDSTQYGDAASHTLVNNTAFDGVAYGDGESGTTITYTVPASNGKVTISYFFAGQEGDSATPEILLSYVSPANITFQFRNFTGLANGTADLVGDFTVNGWTHGAYTLNFDASGNADVTVSDQEGLNKILFRLVVGGGDWGAPAGVDYSVLEPNAWDNLDDDHSYESGDSNWGIGNEGEAKPDGGFAFGSDYTVTIDAAGGGRASMAIDGTTVWE